MKTFVVSYTSFFDNEAKMAKVTASSPTQAVVVYLEMHAGYTSQDAEELLSAVIHLSDPYDSIKHFMFNQDVVVGALEI